MTNLTHKPRPCTDKHIMNHYCNAPNNSRHCPLIRLARQHLIREMINIFFCSFKRSWPWFYTIISIFLRRRAFNRNVGRIQDIPLNFLQQIIAYGLKTSIQTFHLNLMANLMIFKLLSYRNHNEAKSTIITDLSFDVRVFESLQYTCI